MQGAGRTGKERERGKTGNFRQRGREAKIYGRKDRGEKEEEDINAERADGRKDDAFDDSMVEMSNVPDHSFLRRHLLHSPATPRRFFSS